jgi:excisionase family DNA binding protein
MLTLSQVAERLNLHYNTIYHYVRSGELKAIKFDKVYRVKEQELEKFIRGKNFKVEGGK